MKLFFNLQQMLFQRPNDWQNKYTHLTPVSSPNNPNHFNKDNTKHRGACRLGWAFASMHFHLPISQFIHQEMTQCSSCSLSVTLLKCNSMFMVKFQAAKHAPETFAAALLGAQKGSKAEARTEWAQTSPKPIFCLASHSSKQDRQQTSWSVSLQIRNQPLWIKLDGLLVKANVLTLFRGLQK